MLVLRRLFIFILLVPLPPFLIELVFFWPPERMISGVGIYLMLLSIWATVLIAFSRFIGYDLQSLFSGNERENNQIIERTEEYYEATVPHDITVTNRPNTIFDEATAKFESPLLTSHPVAYLVALDHNYPLLPEKVTLYADPEIRIGRSPQFCDIVLTDKRISRLHSTIISEQNTFRIRDEGSTGGTYVNHVKLEPNNEKLLEANDIIHFYTIAYRFEPAKSSDSNSVDRIQGEDKENNVADSTTVSKGEMAQ